MIQKKWWIKTRYNPQLDTYYVACGLLSKTKAKDLEKTLYGENVMTSYDDQASYLAALAAYREQGSRVA